MSSRSGVAFAVLDAAGTIMAVDAAWSGAQRPAAAFGKRFPPGESYPALCEFWLRANGTELAETVRAVLAGIQVDARIVYEYADEGATVRSEVQVTPFVINEVTFVVVLHVDQNAEARELDTRETRTSVARQTEALARHARQLIEARDKALVAMRLKAEFMANLSHEIRTPMNGILGMTDLALGTRLTPEGREYLVAVRSSAHSLLSLLNNILDFSGFESGGFELTEAPFGLRETLRGILEPLERRATNDGLELILELDPQIPDRLRGDAERLGIVIHNLVDNAIKFTERGSITVRGLLEAPQDASVRVRFEVIDTGCGIDSAQHELILEPFAQVDGSSTRRHGGTGLGLTIANQITALMGGTIDLHSQTGIGSAFSFTLPFKPAVDVDQGSDPPAPEPDDVAPAGTPPEFRSIRVLVAEDNPVAQRMARVALERHGQQVEIVDNGKAAVIRATSGAVDLVLMDIDLPVHDGLAATALIRQAEKTTGQHVPIVAVTGEETIPDRERFRRAGMDDVLPKPFEAGRLEAVLSAFAAPIDETEQDATNLELIELPLVDARRLLDQAGGDPELVAELIEMFLQERAQILEPLVSAIERCDPDELEQAAHKLKGTFGALAAPRATEAARRLELIGRGGDLQAAAGALDLLQQETRRLQTELESINCVPGR